MSDQWDSQVHHKGCEQEAYAAEIVPYSLCKQATESFSMNTLLLQCCKAMVSECVNSVAFSM